ncbi:MAG: hypothetical protein VXY93_11715, partial [Pseudomonadota bacterium]|nr:hypothetical protein [Pseudomonadota bacterium]
VTSIDSVGIITAQKGIHVGAGVSAVGVGTFGSLDIGGDIDVDGHTNLDNVSIAGVSTFASNVSVGNSITVSGLIQATGGTNNGIKVGSNLHIRDEVNVNLEHKGIGSIYLKAVNHELRTTSNERFLVAGSAVGNGVGLYHFDGSSSTEKFRVTSSGVTVYGTAVATGADINGDLDVDGHTNLDNVSIAGVTTFTDGVYSNSSINLGGELNFTGNGHKYIDVATLNGSNTLTIRHQDGGSYETAAYFDANGGAYLQFNGNTKFATTNTGAVVTGSVTATQFNSVNGSNTAYFKDNQLSFSPTGDAYIDHGTTARDIYFRLSRASALDTNMMQFDSDGEIIKFHKMISVGLQGGGDTATLGGGSGVGAQLTLKYADGNFNTRL